MEKVYILSKRKDAELEQLIHNMDAYHLRIFLYGVARGWGFDEACSIAEEAAQHSVQRTGDGLWVCEKCGEMNYFDHCEKCGNTPRH